MTVCATDPADCAAPPPPAYLRETTEMVEVRVETLPVTGPADTDTLLGAAVSLITIGLIALIVARTALRKSVPTRMPT